MKPEHITTILNINPNFEIARVHEVWGESCSCIVDTRSFNIIIRLSNYKMGSYDDNINDAYDPIVQDFCNLLGYKTCSVTSNFDKFVAYLKLHFREELTLR